MNGIKKQKEVKNYDTSYADLQIPNNENTLSSLPREEEEIAKNEYIEHLMFEYKDVSPCKFFFHFLGPTGKFVLIIASLATMISGCSDVVKNYLIGDALNELGETQEIEKLTGKEYETKINTIEKEIDKTIRRFLIYGAIIYVFDFLSFFLWFYLGLRLMYNYSTKYFALLLNQEQKWFDKINVFEFSTKIQAQIEGIEGTIEDSPRFIILFTINIIAGFVIGFIKSWKLTLILSACSLPFLLACQIINTYRIEKQRILDLKNQERATAIAEEIIRNIKTVASFANFDYEIQRYDDAFKGPSFSRFLNPQMIMGIAMFGIFLGFVITCIYARKLVNDNSLNAGDVATVVLSVRVSFFIMYWLAPKYIPIKQSAALSSDYFNLLERVPDFYYSPANLKPPVNSIKGNVEFRNVKFAYEDQKLVLDGLNLKIESGKMVALIGRSGSGKTTTMSLLERIYDPIEGVVLLDGINVKEYNLDYLRNIVGYVQQEHFLYNKSIRDNIILGREEYIKQFGNIDELLDKACSDAHIKDFIESKPEKYDYLLGVKGRKLLPGYKQCLAIARALVGQPRVLVLDEPTANLDNESEQQVMEVLQNLAKQNITVIIIENKINVLKNVDTIYVLNDGKIIEQGNYEQLLSSKNSNCEKLFKYELRNLYYENNYNIRKNYTLTRLTPKYNYVMTKTLKYQIGQLDEKSIKFNSCNIFKLICDQKTNLILGTIFAFFFGAGLAYIDYLCGLIGTKFTLKDHDEMKKQVLKWSLILLLVVAIWIICDFMTNYIFGGLASTVASKTRTNLMRKYLEMHVGFFDFEANFPSFLLSTLSIDSNYLGLYFSTIYNNIFETAGLTIMSLIIGFYYCWRITLILMAFIVIRILIVFLAGLFKNNARKKYKETSIMARSFFTECITNTKSVFSYNFTKEAIRLYKSILDSVTSDYLRDSAFLGLFLAAINCLAYPANSVAYKCGITFIRKRLITFDHLIYAKTTLMSIIDAELYYRVRGLLDIYKIIIAYKYIYKILLTPSEINAFENVNRNKISANALKGKIEFKNVSFAYPTKPSYDILKNVSFIIPPGTRTAIIGNMETGKSTILQLIERFYDVCQGEILIDDINIKDYNLYELRKKIGLVK